MGILDAPGYTRAQIDAKTTGIARATTSGLAAVQAIPNLKWLFTPDSGFFSDTAGTTATTANAAAVRCWKNAASSDHLTDTSGTLTLSQGIGSGAQGVKFANNTNRMRTTGTFDTTFNAGYTYAVVVYDPTLAATKVALSSGDGRFYHGYGGGSATPGLGPVWTASSNTPSPRIPVDMPLVPATVNPDPIAGNTMVEIVRYNGPATKTDVWFDGYYAQGNANTSATALALTGVLTVGGLPASFPWAGTILAVAVFNRAITDAEVAVVNDYLTAVTRTMPRPHLNLIGNSLTAGTGASSGPSQLPVSSGTSMPGYASFDGRDYPSQLMHRFAYRDVIVRVDAYPGRRGAQILSEMPRTTQALFTPSTHPRQVTVVWEITNSVAQNIDPNYNAVLAGTSPPAYSELVTICQTLQSQGWLVGVVTCLPRSDLTNAADVPKFYRTYQAINALVRTNWPAWANFLIDPAADPRIGLPGCELDTTYFDADKVHMKDAGYQVMADLVEAAVAPFIPKSRPRPTFTRSVAGAVSVTLKSSDFATITGRSGDGVAEFTGALTASINVIVPRVAGASALFVNNTTGAFTLTVKSSTGTGVAITQGKKVRLYCDGTNWLAASVEI